MTVGSVRSKCINVGFLGCRKGVVTLTHWPIGHPRVPVSYPLPQRGPNSIPR